MGKVGAIVQARMGSTRLPGKVLSPVAGLPLLLTQLFRMEQSLRVDQVVVATTTNREDDAIEAVCRAHGFEVFRGSEDHVLERYLLCARDYHFDPIVRITGDCPLIDPRVIDDVVAAYETDTYVSNTLQRSFPRGMDTEVFSYAMLDKVYQKPLTPREKEHVTLHFYEHMEQFVCRNVSYPWNASMFRLTVDEPQDLELIRVLLEDYGFDRVKGSLEDLLTLFFHHRHLQHINEGVEQKKT